MSRSRLGLSPRVRGNPLAGGNAGVLQRSIPARAGEPRLLRFPHSVAWVYPRACGGTPLFARRSGRCRGLSPRVRGNHGKNRSRATNVRSIPARAGEPAPPSPDSPSDRVYPRACGGTATRPAQHITLPGLSPRVRGNRQPARHVQSVHGSIPARAGEPYMVRKWHARYWVYPRACGGTRDMAHTNGMESGLSPRVRGNRRTVHGAPQLDGSIPARAGEPCCARTCPRWNRVYPRACGGTNAQGRSNDTNGGLSPRVRGNPAKTRPGRVRMRSIPARAGEPTGRWSALRASRVYPRACGGTGAALGVALGAEGLSPRVRGNPTNSPGVSAIIRSIPARAGEPPDPCWGTLWTRVYPRACGGTAPMCRLLRRPWGLSPRVRGNRQAVAVHGLCYGSIPARAGEPSSEYIEAARGAVYPRACGGTLSGTRIGTAGRGLSPRVRGNHQDRWPVRENVGSIPARAGEPSGVAFFSSRSRVYPRACGGTSQSPTVVCHSSGLSPRVRGNLPGVLVSRLRGGSIPARAGEPKTSA